MVIGTKSNPKKRQEKREELERKRDEKGQFVTVTRSRRRNSRA